MFLQELRKKPLLPHVYNWQGHQAVVLSNVSPHHEHGTGLVVSPLPNQFVIPCVNPNKERLATAALLTLPGAQPLLVASIYAPGGETWRSKVETAHRLLLQKYPNLLFGGDFTAWSILCWTGNDCKTTTIGGGYGARQPPAHPF